MQRLCLTSSKTRSRACEYCPEKKGGGPVAFLFLQPSFCSLELALGCTEG